MQFKSKKLLQNYINCQKNILSSGQAIRRHNEQTSSSNIISLNRIKNHPFFANHRVRVGAHGKWNCRVTD